MGFNEVEVYTITIIIYIEINISIFELLIIPIIDSRIEEMVKFLNNIGISQILEIFQIYKNVENF